MARKKKTGANGTSRPSAQQMQEWYTKNKSRVENYAKGEDAIKNLRDVTKTSTYRTISNFNKESLRIYLQNVSSNEKNLRNLSRYLYYRSQVYYRLIAYNSNMFCLNARSVIPNYKINEDNDKDSILKSYSDTLDALDKMNLDYEFLKIYMTCYREDVFFGVYYFDPDSDSNTSFFVLPLDPDYCKIQGVYRDTGDFAFSMDMSYFRKNSDLLEYWGEPFQSLYKQYEKDNVKWQPVPPEYGICLKARAEDWETVVPVFSGLLNSLISLLDLEDIQAITDEQQIYKLVWLELETLSNANDSDDWKVNPKLMIQYFNRMVDEALPDYTSAAIIPGKLNTISFDNDQATDTNKIEKATETVLNTSGGAQILNSASITGTTAFNAALKSDSEFAISMLLPQTQAVVNRILSYYVDNPSKVKFLEVSTYTKDAYKESVLKDNTYGLAPKLLVNSLNGFSEKETIALNYLESECLELNFTPVQSSHTISNTGESGGQTKSTSGGAGSITDEGEASQDKRDNSNG